MDGLFRLAAFLLVAVLASDVDPETGDENGRPALLLAARSGREDVVRALLRGGADPDAATRSGWSALHEAAEKGAVEVARALLDGGAAPDPRDRVRATPLDVAEQGGRRDVAHLLRARGARGGGKSIGDTVCVRPWGGDGFCSVVQARDPTRHQLRITRIVGCPFGCPPDAACSAGRRVGPGGLGPGEVLWVPSSCLTHTGLR